MTSILGKAQDMPAPFQNRMEITTARIAIEEAQNFLILQEGLMETWTMIIYGKGRKISTVLVLEKAQTTMVHMEMIIEVWMVPMPMVVGRNFPEMEMIILLIKMV